MKYLEEEQRYIDRYDLHTIEECLEYYWFTRDRFIKEKESTFPKYSNEKFQTEMNKCLSLMLFALKGERYRHKKEMIQKWMDKDRRMQELYDNTPPPQDVNCQSCKSPMTVTFKDLHDSYRDDARMMFMFECPKCKKRQALFENGTEWKYDPPKCPKCKHPLKTDMKFKGDITTSIFKCTKCDYKDKDISDHGKFKKEQAAKEKGDKELLEKQRSEFCLSDKDGQEYLEYTEALEYSTKIREEEILKYDNSIYERSIQLKKISIAELEKLLVEKFEKENYIKLSFDKPDMGEHIIVPFSVQDADISRKNFDSTSKLRAIVKDALKDTNWRYTSESFSYRLGIVTGRLKGVEGEEDMLELAGKKKESRPSKEDEEKRMKYDSHHLVQWARLMGEFEGIERLRKRRLEKEPDGFLLEESEGSFSCRVCDESIPDGKAWWSLNAITCLDCQRNIKEGIVPPEFFDDDYGYDGVLKDWQIKSNYGVHPGTIGKLHRSGLLKGRDLKRKDGTIYETLYVISENKEFFETHPKKPEMKIEWKTKDDKGKQV